MERFLDFIQPLIHLLALLDPFTDPNDRFLYLSIYILTKEIPALSYT